MDTETYRGTVRVLADSEGAVLWDPTTEQMLDFIHRPHNRVAWYNLRYDIECILKGLSDEETNLLLATGEVGAYGYHLSYIPKKQFRIRDPSDRYASKHYDIAQFYSTSLDRAAREHLGEQKEGLSRAEVSALGSTRAAWDRHDPAVIEGYCLQDCRLVQRLAVLWESWADARGVDFTDPISPAYLAGLYAAHRGWPHWSEEDHEVLGPCAWEAYSGGRFESRVKGWGTYYFYDINSAYPFVMTQLPDPEVPWVRQSVEARARSFPWGLVQAEVWVGDALEWGPLPVQQRVGPLYYPVGYLGKRWMTLWEYETFSEHPDIRLDFVKAWVAEDDGDRPLAWLADLFLERLRKKREGDPTQAVDKVIMNSVYGKMMQKNPLHEYVDREPRAGDDIAGIWSDDEGAYYAEPQFEQGPLFHPVWGAHTTAGVRLMIWEMLMQYDIATVATDGVLSREPVHGLDCALGDSLGQWSSMDPCDGVVVGNGLYQLVGHPPKRRGFGEPLAGFEWISALQSVPDDATELVVKDERPLHPGEVMRSLKWTRSDIGSFVTFDRHIDLNGDQKRVFPRVTARDLLNGQTVGKPVKLK